MGIITGIGSGGSYALAAARALLDLPDMDAETIGQCVWFLTSIPLLTYAGNSLRGLSGIVIHAVSLSPMLFRKFLYGDCSACIISALM
jgi:hypothetical protein